MKVTVVGAGHVGATTAQRLVEGNIADVYLVDIVDGLAAGKALDLAQAAPLVGHGRKIVGGTEYAGAEGSDVVVITAGIARKPGMSRDDLLMTNGKIVTGIVEEIMAVAPDAILIMVTNPLDVTTHIAMEVSGQPRERVMGMAGALDTARFRAFIGMELGCASSDVQAMVLGGHGDSMVPLASSATVGGVPITQLIEPGRLEEIIQRTRDGGAEIVGLLKTGSAFYAPSAGVTEMVGSILRNENKVMPVSVLLQGEYGIEDTFVGVPVKLGAGGVEEIIEVKLSDDENAALRASAEHVRETVAAWERLSK
ncbi:MAG: malate dehydrogenase [candidate division WS1 bacterium]|jgi:malate dehydrogenase|nr:malate dehydrogenase [candidate division WS1 bacterium]